MVADEPHPPDQERRLLRERAREITALLSTSVNDIKPSLLLLTTERTAADFGRAAAPPSAPMPSASLVSRAIRQLTETVREALTLGASRRSSHSIIPVSPGRTAVPTVGARPVNRRHRILYIEDNLSNLTLVQRILERQPAIDLIPALQGTLGLDLAREHQPDLGTRPAVADALPLGWSSRQPDTIPRRCPTRRSGRSSPRSMRSTLTAPHRASRRRPR